MRCLEAGWSPGGEMELGDFLDFLTELLLLCIAVILNLLRIYLYKSAGCAILLFPSQS